MTIEIDLGNLEPNDIMVVVPATMFPGEQGTPFTEEGKLFLRNMAVAGYWPIDFGEGTDTYLSLWMRLDFDNAAVQAEHFITCGGDV